MNVTSQGIFTAQTAFYVTEVIEIFPVRGHGNPLQYSCLENPMDKLLCPWGHNEPDTTERLSTLTQRLETEKACLSYYPSQLSLGLDQLSLNSF